MKTKEEIVYTGAFKEIFEGYIAYKISLGFNLEYREQRQLLKLNRHLNRYTADNVKITKADKNGVRLSARISQYGL